MLEEFAVVFDFGGGGVVELGDFLVGHAAFGGEFVLVVGVVDGGRGVALGVFGDVAFEGGGVVAVDDSYLEGVVGVVVVLAFVCEAGFDEAGGVGSGEAEAEEEAVVGFAAGFDGLDLS